MVAQMSPIAWTVAQIAAPKAWHKPTPASPQPRVYSLKAARLARDALAAAATPLSIEQLSRECKWTINQSDYRIRAGLAHDLVEVAHRPTTRAGRHTYRAAKDE